MTQGTGKQPVRGLGEQISATKASFGRLWRAHVNLLKAEFNEIASQLKQIATLAGVALGIALMTGTLLYVGGWLFMGEWLFGSIGWGLAHGVLFGLALISRARLRHPRRPRPDRRFQLPAGAAGDHRHRRPVRVERRL